MRSGAEVRPWPPSTSTKRKRRKGREGANALQCGSGSDGRRQAEGCVWPLSAALGLGAQRGQLGIHLHAGAKQKNVALESAQLEEFGKPVDCRRRLHGSPGFFD